MSVTIELIEDADLQIHPVSEGGDVGRGIPPVVSFLNGFERWNVAAYDGIAPIVQAYLAAAVRRRAGGTLRTTHERRRELVIAPLDVMSAAVRETLARQYADVEAIEADQIGSPARFFDNVASLVRRARSRLERELGEDALDDLAGNEWLVVDGSISRSPDTARHPRALGIVQSRGAQFLEGRGLRLAMTLPAGHRTSVFCVRGRRTSSDVYSWFLRLWPWEGQDLLYGLLRIEARVHVDVIARATELSGWLLAERAPLATPAARWDRLLYPLHNVEEYLKSRATAPTRLAISRTDA